MNALGILLLAGAAVWCIRKGNRAKGVGGIGFVDKQAQLDLILSTNPADDENLSYHTWIRSVEDILTYQEAAAEDGVEDCAPDYTAKMIDEALRTGYIEVYSSHYIVPGVFVTPSKMEASNYGTPVHSKYVKTTDVAWIDLLQGMYAPVNTIGVGKLSDDPLSLDNILRGVERGWYQARVQLMDGFGWVVYLSGKKADGEYTEEVFPISEQTAQALQQQGIGRAPKRRIYEELADAQRSGIELYEAYNEAQDKELAKLAHRYGYKGSNRSSRSLSEQYFNSLKRAYNAVAGTRLPYKESIIYNNLGDEVIRYRNYGTDEQKFQAALDELCEGYGETGMYWRILGMIASGGLKFLWTLPEKQLQAGNKGLQEELFGRKAPKERKNYRKLLATAANGGLTPSRAAEQIASSAGDPNMDDMATRNILLDVLQEVTSPEQARNRIMDAYYDMYKEETMDDWNFEQGEQTRMFEEFTGDDEMPF